MATVPKVDEIHASSKIEEVELSKLKIDHSYQRDISEKLVDGIANNFDEIASELLLISNRGVRQNDEKVDGGLFIVNGQHRSKAGQKIGRDKMWSRVIDLRKEEDPAAIEAGFRIKTNKGLQDRPLERFKAQVRSGFEESLAIVKIMTSFKTQINTENNSEQGINCVSTVEAMYRLDDGALLRDTLEVVRDTWKEIGGANAKAPILKGISWFVDKHAEESDRTRLINKLQTTGLTALQARSKATGLTLGGAQWLNTYRAVVDMYNEGLREKSRLQWATRGSQRLNRGGGTNPV